MKQQSIPPQPDENFLPVSRQHAVQMADKRAKRTADHDRINLRQPYELGYWSRKFGVSEKELAEAVQKVGNNAEDVAIELGKSW